MRRLHTYLRASMSQKRLSSLTLLYIHYDRPVDWDLAVSIYARLHPRWLELESIVRLTDAEMDTDVVLISATSCNWVL